MTAIKESFAKIGIEPRSMTDEIRELDYQHWTGIISLASKANGADDLNKIVCELGRLFEHVGREYPLGFWSVLRSETHTQIENAITQWPDYSYDFEGDEWDLPDVYIMYSVCGPDNSPVFKKDDNTIIMWDALEGKYIECSRATKEAETCIS